MATWLAKKTPFAHVFYQKWGSIASLAMADPNIIGSGWLGGACDQCFSSIYSLGPCILWFAHAALRKAYTTK